MKNVYLVMVFVQFPKGFLQEAFLYHFPIFLQCCTTSLFGLNTFQFKQQLEAKLIRPAEGSWDQEFINLKGNNQCETLACMLLLVILFFHLYVMKNALG